MWCFGRRLFYALYADHKKFTIVLFRNILVYHCLDNKMRIFCVEKQLPR